MRLRFILILPVLLLLAGCASATHSHLARVDIAPGVTLTLPDRPPFGSSANVVQLVQAVYGDRTESFQAVISSSADEMKLMMTAPNGPRIMSLEWRNHALNTKFEPIAPKGLSAEHMLADIMMIYARPDILDAAIGGAHLLVGPDGSRELVRSGRTIVKVTFRSGPLKNPWDGRAVLENLAFGYRLEIESHPTGP